MSEKRKQSSILEFFSSKISKSDSSSDRLEVNAGIISEDSTSEGNPSTSKLDNSPEYKSLLDDPNDIYFFKSKHIENDEKIKILDKIWKPDSKYKFPVRMFQEGFNRKFQYSWLEKYSWLAYSAIEDSAYCKYCFLFSAEKVGKTSSQSVGNFVRDGFKNWKRALESFERHASNQYHINSVLCANDLRDILSHKKISINLQLNHEHLRQKIENRKRLSSIIKTVILCGKQGLPLRGHRDYGPLSIEWPKENEGNFRALLRARVDAGDKDLEYHIKNASKNALYTSWDIQNQIIEACGTIIQRKVIEEIRANKYFSILADETTDVSTTEQLTLCVRYISEDFNVHEKFLSFVPLKALNGKEIASTILSEPHKHGISTKYLRGQGYDGAATMSGKDMGTQAFISKEQPLAIYVHCISHCLNLAISDSCEIQDIRNCMGIIEKTFTFFNTPKRQIVLTTKIDVLCPESRKHKLKKMCPTRWVARHDSVLVYGELFDAICASLEEITVWKDKDASSGAMLLLNSIQKINFIVSLKVVETLFGYSVGLSKILQSEDLDLSTALQHAGTLKKLLEDLRKNADTEFGTIFNKVTCICEKYNIPPQLPRITNRQTYRMNIKTDDVEKYYKISIFLPFIDIFITQISNRFLKHESILSSFMCLTDRANDSLIEFKKLIKMYETDLETANEITLECEFKMWKKELSRTADSKLSAISALSKCSIQLFPNISILLKILCTLPVSTATPERTYSTLKRLKTYLRSTMGAERMTGLALLHIYYDFEFNIDDVLDILARSERRLNI